MALLENIKQACKDKNIAVCELEKQAGLGENSIFTWNKVNPSADKVKRVADVLETTMDDLMKE